MILDMTQAQLSVSIHSREHVSAFKRIFEVPTLLSDGEGGKAISLNMPFGRYKEKWGGLGSKCTNNSLQWNSPLLVTFD